jgi:hypothetical protein
LASHTTRRGLEVTDHWYGAFATAWRWGSFIAAHALVALVLIGVIALIQRLILQLGDPKLFDMIPLRYIFDGMDLGILAAFLVLGSVEAVNVFRGHHG